MEQQVMAGNRQRTVQGRWRVYGSFWHETLQVALATCIFWGRDTSKHVETRSICLGSHLKLALSRYEYRSQMSCTKSWRTLKEEADTFLRTEYGTPFASSGSLDNKIRK